MIQGYYAVVECDTPDCPEIELIEVPQCRALDETELSIELSKYGWFSSGTGYHYCPKHAQKAPETACN